MNFDWHLWSSKRLLENCHTEGVGACQEGRVVRAQTVVAELVLGIGQVVQADSIALGVLEMRPSLSEPVLP